MRYPEKFIYYNYYNTIKKMIKASPSISEVESLMYTRDTIFFPLALSEQKLYHTPLFPPPDSSYIIPSSSQKHIIYTVQFTCCIDIRNHLFICIDDLRAHFIDHSYILMIYPKKKKRVIIMLQRELTTFQKRPIIY